MQRLEVSGVVRPIYGSTHIWIVRRQTVNVFPRFYCLCFCPVHIDGDERADHPSVKSYQISVNKILS